MRPQPALPHPLPRWLLPAFATLLVVGLALPWALWAPPFEKPDEIHHVGYVVHLLRQGRLPDPREPLEPFARLEAHQPPLYYLVGAGTLGLAERLGLERIDLEPWQHRHNEQFRGGRGSPDPGSHEVGFFEHGGVGWFDDPDFPPGLLLLRLLSTAMAAAAAWQSARLLQALFADRPLAALAATLAATILPTRVMLSSAVNNDVLAWLFGALALRLALAISRKGAWAASLKAHAVLGVVIGLGLLTKLTLVTAAPLLLAGIGRAPWRRWLAAVAAAGAATALVAGPWFLRNALRYGDALGRQERIDPTCCLAWVRERTVVQVLGDPAFWRNTWDTGLASFGFVNLWLPAVFYSAAWLLLALAALGWALRLAAITVHRVRVAPMPEWLRRGAEDLSAPVGPDSRALLLCLSFAASSLAALVAYNLHYNQQQGRYLFHAGPAWAMLVACGWIALWQVGQAPLRRWLRSPTTWALLLTGLGIAINGWGLFGVSLPAYHAEVEGARVVEEPEPEPAAPLPVAPAVEGGDAALRLTPPPGRP